jgi:hypothetical protein
MATGILAVGLHAAGREIPSLIALAIAAALWPLLAASFLADLIHNGHRWWSPPDAPPALTVVAATATGIGWLRPLGVVLLWVAVAACLYLVTNVVALRSRRPSSCSN